MNEDDKKDPWLGSPDSKRVTEPAKEMKSDSQSADHDWERNVIQEIALASVKEQRRTRRWGIFFKILIFVGYPVLFYFALSTSELGDSAIGSNEITALVEVQGVIAANSEANADAIITGLRSAFKNKKTKAVIVRLNSPGGSPVQAGYVYDEIMRLKKLNPGKKVYAVITDVCASGGYYIAAAADEIYADKASIVGSIGVLMDGFGFVDTMKKMGVERRLMTAGTSKGFMDPFSPLKDSDEKHIKTLLDSIHQQFINAVTVGRQGKLSKNPDIFSGLVWTGEQGVTLGLIDGLGSSSYVARELVGAKKLVDFTYRQPAFERFAERIGVTLADRLTTMGWQLK